MKRSETNSLHRDEKPGPSRHEDDKNQPRPKSEDERLRRRREWKIQLQREREHEKLKQKMILEYEIRRAKEKGLPVPPRRSSSASSLSKSRSESMESRHGTPSRSKSPRQPVMSQKIEASIGMKQQLFKGPEGTRISTLELRKIKIDIHRNIPQKAAMKGDLQRDIVNPEDVVLKRREGEGAKPIFEREEIKKGTDKDDEVEEHRTIMAIDEISSATSTQRSKRRSASLSPASKHSHSPHRALSRHSRRENVKQQSDRPSHRDEHKSRSTDRSREHRDRHRVSSDRRKESSRATDSDRRSRSRGRSKEHDRRPRSRDRSSERRDRHKDHDKRREEQDAERSHHRREHRDRSREKSREREGRGRDRDYYRRSDKEDRFRDRSRDRRDRARERDRSRDRSRDRRLSVTSQYIEPVPVPVYYGNFPPRPIMVGPILPFRGQIPVYRARHPGVLAPVRPFPPRFQPPPDLYRLGMPHPRFGRMF